MWLQVAQAVWSTVAPLLYTAAVCISLHIQPQWVNTQELSSILKDQVFSNEFYLKIKELIVCAFLLVYLKRTLAYQGIKVRFLCLACRYSRSGDVGLLRSSGNRCPAEPAVLLAQGHGGDQEPHCGTAFSYSFMISLLKWVKTRVYPRPALNEYKKQVVIIEARKGQNSQTLWVTVFLREIKNYVIIVGVKCF